MKFNYYYGYQSDQFSFIRIPRVMLTDETFAPLSLPAKMLYSVFLDRMGLSMRNSWFDEQNRVFIIYQISEIQEDLGFSKRKAMDYLAERFGRKEKEIIRFTKCLVHQELSDTERLCQKYRNGNLWYKNDRNQKC